MSTAQADRYALGHTPEEYERLRLQARVWEAATGRLLDEVGLAAGASCLDAGCGPGETMRLMAERVGPAGRVAGHRRGRGARRHGARATCTARATASARGTRHDITADDADPRRAVRPRATRGCCSSTCPERVAVLARLWDAVAPGGHLSCRTTTCAAIGVLPALASVEEVERGS